MNTDLVGAAGLKTKRDKAVPICFFYHFIMGDCIFSMFPVYGPFDDGSFLAPERSLDGSFGDIPGGLPGILSCPREYCH